MSDFGAISTPEDLIRIVVSPYHVKREKIIPALLSVAEKKGMSTLRSTYATDNELRLTANQLVNAARKADPKAGVFGVVTMRAEAIKAIVDDERTEPVFCIYDTATHDKPAHADVFQRVVSFSEPIKQARRQALFGHVKARFESVDQFRGGLLLPWAFTAAG